MDNEELSFLWRTAIDHFSESAIGRLLNLLRSLPVFFKTKTLDIKNTSTEIIVNTCSKQFAPAPPTTKSISFPLRRLSYVALQEVFKHMDLIQLIELSLCSKKCIQLVKIARRNKGLYIRLTAIFCNCLNMHTKNAYFENCFLSVYKKNQNKNGINLYDGMINGHKFKYYRTKNNTFNTYWENITAGRVEIFKYITDLFHYPRIIEAHIVEIIPIRPLYDWIALKYGGRSKNFDFL
ncbi:hypothetical protein CAEBREN_06756 [Caenorhabditis brenneri]|uniref:F-box domain-containing protein n=1 Tax=Caenorhabditis brenneri TaxID=135651 RepID=G0MBX4_CAEBE|nr:hypothetical protein CAEBREN_06756 [Caenorhabditis brenneri]